MRIAPHDIETIIAATNGKKLGESTTLISNVSFDSRSQTINENTLFIALKGNNTDGHKHSKEAYEKGCRTFLVSTEIELENSCCILVNDVLKALQNLAQHHRETLNIPVIGITGSYGKTTVKEWLYQLLRNKFNVARSPKSYNSQIGVPISILSIQKTNDLAIIEAGISQPGDMEKLQQIIQPTFGIFTGIGKAHQENFSSPEQQKEEKYKLFQKTTDLVSIDDIAPSKFIVPFTDDASIQNAQLACLAALKIGADVEEIQTGAGKLKSIALRMEVVEGKYNNIIINDFYNSDENGLEIAIDFLKQKSEGKQTLVISSFGDINTEKLRKESGINEWITFGSIDSIKEIIKKISSIENTAILIKGTQNNNFLKLSKALQKTNHATTLEIDLNAVTNNYNVFKNRLKPETKMMLMVKAFGYGSGSVELAKHLVKLGADYFGVAYASEGEQLRKAKIDLPIMVMSPEQSSFDVIIDNNLEPEIYSIDLLDDFIRELINHGKTEYPIHLKIDTGMNRQGFLMEELLQACQIINAQPEVRVASVFSHLAASDEPQNDQFTHSQIRKFEEANQIIEQEIGDTYIKHILNTHGIINFPYNQYNMVRLGIGLFGEDFSGKLKHNLENVSTFKTTITQIKHVKKGESIGYGRHTILTEDKTIGIIPVGYADGYFRALSNKAEVFVNGQKAPIIGSICMDISMIDLSNTEAKVGDRVELFGENISLSELAQKAETIPYEILTSISSRVKRVYLSE